MDGCLRFVVGGVGVLVILVIIVDSPAFRTATNFLATALSLALAGPIVYFVIKQVGVSQRMAGLRKVLAQVAGRKPIEVTPALSTVSVEWQESVIRNRHRIDRLTMTFAWDAEDGEIHTTVGVEPKTAWVRMVLFKDSIELAVLADHHYSEHWRRIEGLDQSPEAVHHVREWMRRRILPELKEAKKRRESEARRLAVESDAKLEEERRKREEYKRKYLP